MTIKLPPHAECRNKSHVLVCVSYCPDHHTHTIVITRQYQGAPGGDHRDVHELPWRTDPAEVTDLAYAVISEFVEMHDQLDFGF